MRGAAASRWRCPPGSRTREARAARATRGRRRRAEGALRRTRPSVVRADGVVRSHMDGRTLHGRVRLSLRPRARFPGPARGPEARDPPHRPAGQGRGGARDPRRDGHPHGRRSAPALPAAIHRSVRGRADRRPAARGAGDRDRPGAEDREAVDAPAAVDGDRDARGRERHAGPDVLQPAVGGRHLQGGSGARRLGDGHPVPGSAPAGEPGGRGPRWGRARPGPHGADHAGPSGLRGHHHPDDP